MTHSLFRWTRHAPLALALTVGLGALEAVVMIAQMTFLSIVVERIFLAHENITQVLSLLLLLLTMILIHAGLRWAREVTALQGAVRIKAELRERVFAYLFTLGPTYSRGERTGELLATLGDGIERLDAYISRYLPQMALSVLIPLFIVCYIFPFDWPSAVLLFATGPVIPLLMILVGSYAEIHIQRQWLALSRMSAYFLDTIQGLPTLKIFGRGDTERERIARVSNRFRDRTLKALKFAFLSGLVLEFMAAAAIGLVAVTLGIRLLDGGISFAHALLILLLAPEFYRPLRELGVHRHAGMEGKAVAQRINEILETKPLVHSSTVTSDWSVEPLTIELRDVAYTYPGNETPALQGINLVLQAHSRTALVGRSGAGKSTFVNMLLRFIDAECGSIMVNGKVLADLPIERWREQIALVPQRPYLFYGSVSTNIRLARPSASDQEVILAAELAGATEFIQHFAKGYDTMIGEQGARLSAGQAQRIALARAFLKDAPFLILDEPTSSLDPKSEVLIRQALERLMQQRTVLVVAHRLNTIAHMEQIAVMENGKIVECGQHTELLACNGAYADLLSAYRKGYITV